MACLDSSGLQSMLSDCSVSEGSGSMNLTQKGLSDGLSITRKRASGVVTVLRCQPLYSQLGPR